MANNLLDIIKQNTSKITEVAPPQEQTSEISRLLQAKQGKAVPQAGLAQVSLAERTELAGTQQGLQGIARAGEIQTAQLEQQQEALRQQANIQQQELAQKGKAQEQAFGINLDSTLQKLSQENRSLDFDKDRSQVEQIMAEARLSNDKYITNLNMTAARQRLDNADQFKRAMLQATFDNNVSLLEGKISFENILQSNERDFRKQLSDISIDDIMKTTEQKIVSAERASEFAIGQARTSGELAAKQANLAAIFQSTTDIINGLSQAGIIAYNKPRDTSNPEQGIRDAQAMDNFLTLG